MKTYFADRSRYGNAVLVSDGKNVWELPPRMRTGSRDSFDWGYLGKKPLCLALSLLREVEKQHKAEDLASRFAILVVGKLPDQWQLTESQIKQWVSKVGNMARVR